MVIGYARVSTEQQGTEAQLPDLRKAGCKRVYQETVGGGTTDRPELEKCLERLDQGDTLVVWRLDLTRVYRLIDFASCCGFVAVGGWS